MVRDLPYDKAEWSPEPHGQKQFDGCAIHGQISSSLSRELHPLSRRVTWKDDNIQLVN